MDKKRHSESEEQHSSQMPIKEESSSQEEEEEEEEDKNILKTHNNAIRSSLSRHRSVDNLNEEQNNIQVLEDNKNKKQMYSSMLNLKVVEDGLSSGSKGNNVKLKKKSIRRTG